MNITSIFRLARNVSKHSTYTPRLGAVIVKKGKPISVGFNKDKTNPNYNWSTHAETDALRTAGKVNLSKAIMFVYRELPDGTPANARPCTECMKHIRKSGIKRVYYSVSYPPFYDCEDVCVI